MDSSNSYSLAAIIPCWNCVSEINEMLEALLCQTFSDWNAFLVDDGCQDGTGEIIRKYAALDERFHYVIRDREPKGAPTCRNIGLSLSEGAKYVVFLDADDLIAPYCFEQRVRYLDNHPSIDFASFPLKAFQTSLFDNVYWGFGIQGEQDLLSSLLFWKTLQIVVVSNIYVRDRLFELGIRWDERLLAMQDADFNIQSLTKGLNHAFSEDARIDYFYRQGLLTVSKNIYKDSMLESHLYLLRKEIESIRKAYHSRYDFNLKAYIVNFLVFFQGNRQALQSILTFPFVKEYPAFYLRLYVFYLSRGRGKKYLFKKYIKYTEDAQKTWMDIVCKGIENECKREERYGT